ncbi:MAG: hypothetical protein ACKVTZ_03930 [Bacteroidia bacterium]
MMRNTVFLLFLLCSMRITFAQVSMQDSSINMITLHTSYQGLVPIGVMADRFGFTSTLGGKVGYKLSNNWYATLGFSALFGGQVKEDSIINDVLASSGLAIGANGSFLPVRLQQGGFIVPVSIGKTIPLSFSPNKNSGLYVELGAQFIQHRIDILTPRDRVYILSKQYEKGYDRLTNGIGITEEIGYRLFSNNGYWNFEAGFAFSQNFTQNRRLINIDTGLRDETKRLDLLQGFHVSWILPIFKRAPKKVYYN